MKCWGDFQVWPEEIAHLKGKVLVRKRDGSRYIIRKPWGENFNRKPCAYLEPSGCSFGSRSHWKTYAKILTEMREESK